MRSGGSGVSGSSQPDQGDAPGRRSGPLGSRREVAGYVLAVLVLVVGGAVVRTPILNWLAGPGVVIASVWLTTRNREPGAVR